MTKTLANVVGIDVAKSKLDLACPIQPGKYRTRANVPNAPAGHQQLLTWLQAHAHAEAWVVMEATNVYHEAVAAFLYAHGYRVCVVNPAQVAAYAKSELSRIKTDQTDAKLIVRFGLSHQGQLRAWQPPTPAQRTLMALTRRLDDLKGLRQMESNRLETADPAVHGSLQAVLERLDEQIKATEAAIHQHIDDDPDLRRQRDLLVSIKASRSGPPRACWPSSATSIAFVMCGRWSRSSASTRRCVNRASGRATCASPRSAHPSCAPPCTCRR